MLPGGLVVSDKAETPNRVLGSSVAMGAQASYPEALRSVVRWNTLVGSGNEGWTGIPQGDVRMGLLDLDPGGFYPSHAHPAPEIYYIVSGAAEWSVGAETFAAVAGMAIYHAPNMPHRMVNTGTVPLRTVWFWWAPGGDAAVLTTAPKLLEPMPDAPCPPASRT